MAVKALPPSGDVTAMAPARSDYLQSEDQSVQKGLEGLDVALPSALPCMTFDLLHRCMDNVVLPGDSTFCECSDQSVEHLHCQVDGRTLPLAVTAFMQCDSASGQQCNMVLPRGLQSGPSAVSATEASPLSLPDGLSCRP